MNALTRPAAAPAAPPIGARPERWGKGRVEVQLYPGATTADRLAAARTLLAGTAWTVALEIADRAPRVMEEAGGG